MAEAIKWNQLVHIAHADGSCTLEDEESSCMVMGPYKVVEAGRCSPIIVEHTAHRFVGIRVESRLKDCTKIS